MSIRVKCGPVELRRLTPRWATGIHALASDPRVSANLSWKPHESIDDSLSFIRDTHRLWNAKAAYMFGIFLTGPLRVVGSVGVSSIDRPNRRAEIGTWIGRPYQGKGLNRHVKGAIFAFCFDELDLNRLELVVLERNEHSLRVNLRLPGVVDEGIQHERLIDETPLDARMLAITRSRWDADAYGNPKLTRSP